MRIVLALCVILGLLSINCYADGIIEKDMADKIIKYRLNTVERSKLRVFVKRNYSDSPWDMALKLCNLFDYERDTWNSYSMLRNKKGNCQAFAFLFYMMLDKAQIPSRLAYNDTHMWNEIYIDGEWVVYDLTALNQVFN